MDHRGLPAVEAQPGADHLPRLRLLAVPAGGGRRALRGPGADVADHAGAALGIYNGCKAVADGRKVGPEVLLSGYRQNLPRLVRSAAST